MRGDIHPPPPRPLPIFYNQWINTLECFLLLKVIIVQQTRGFSYYMFLLLHIPKNILKKKNWNNFYDVVTIFHLKFGITNASIVIDVYVKKHCPSEFGFLNLSLICVYSTADLSTWVHIRSPIYSRSPSCPHSRPHEFVPVLQAIAEI